MSQFMQNVVQEVLSRNKTMVTPDRKVQDLSPNQPVPAANPQTLGDIRRPNYQRQKQQERMKADSAPALPKSQSPVVQRQTENPISSLQRLTASQILSVKAPLNQQGGSKGAQLIGKTKNNQLVWCFSSPDSRLSALPVGSMGLITGIADNPGTVFLVEEWIEQQPGIRWEWFGVKKVQGWADTIKIYSRENQDLEQILKGLYNQLNRQAIRPIKSYYVENPTDDLRTSLPFAKGQSVSALAGVSEISALALLDRYFHHHPHAAFQFDVRENLLLLSGDSKVIRGVIQQLEDDAGKLLS